MNNIVALEEEQMNKAEKSYFTANGLSYFNFVHGCSNDCSYCYAMSAIRFKRKTPETWKIEEAVSMQGKSFRKRDGRIMIPHS